MWRGALCFGEARVPVKLYAALADRSVHFRLLHRKDRAPVRQVMVEPEAEQVVPYAESRRARRSISAPRRWLSPGVAR